MQFRFSKMHGLGNDFMIVDLVTQRAELTPELVARLSDRQRGVGFDQLLTLEPPSDPDVDFRYRIYNADGSPAEQCGNGVRCLGRFVRDHKLCAKPSIILQNDDARVVVTMVGSDDAEVDMGVPSLDPEAIPFRTESPGPTHELEADGERVTLTPVSIGNPHAVLEVEDVVDAPVSRLGPLIERHDCFREGVNVGFCQIVDPGFIRLRVHERGVGETQACGSGACAAVVAGRLNGRLGEHVKVSLPGGKLRISWQGPGTPIRMCGPACLVYEGHIHL
ncbi:MAG: diaminopimelate epimerase [Pseudomonadales bacterium]